MISTAHDWTLKRGAAMAGVEYGGVVSKYKLVKRGKNTLILSDGKLVDRVLLTTELEVHESVISKWVHKGEETFNKWIEDLKLKKKFGVSQNSKIYSKDGQHCWVACILEAIDADPDYVTKRLRYWVQGKLDCDELFRPILDRSELGNFYKKNLDGKKSNWGKLTGKQGRSVESLGPDGTWESENNHAQKFTSSSSGGHFVSRDSRGTRYRGD